MVYNLAKSSETDYCFFHSFTSMDEDKEFVNVRVHSLSHGNFLTEEYHYFRNIS